MHAVVTHIQTAKVTAHMVSNGDGSVDRTVFLIKFSAEVIKQIIGYKYHVI